MSYTACELYQKLKDMIDEVGYVSVAIRHVAANDFGPDDDMDNFKVFYDKDADKIIIEVEN